MNFSKYRVQLSTEKSTLVSTSKSTSMSTPSLFISENIQDMHSDFKNNKHNEIVIGYESYGTILTSE